MLTKEQIDKLKLEAQNELNSESAEEAKNLIKEKLEAINVAERVVENLKRELDDLYVRIAHGNL